MDHYSVRENHFVIDQDMILQLTWLPYKISFIPTCNMDDARYEWIDAELESMSSIQLAEILYCNELDGLVNSCVANGARQELIKRGHYETVNNPSAAVWHRSCK